MFDRVVCINLKRRPGRWRQFQAGLPTDWPFGPVVRVDAVDGQTANVPQWYGQPPANLNHNRDAWGECLRGAWGCLQSHLQVWLDALRKGLNSVLVFEDDAVFCPDFTEQAVRFLEAVPVYWDQIYFGGQHLNYNQTPPVKIRAQVLKGHNVNRTHAYAIRDDMMRAAVDRLSRPWAPWRPQDYHVDHQLGAMHLTGEWNVYCPRRWLVGQTGGHGDVNPDREFHGVQWWNDFSSVMREEHALAG